MKRAFGYSTLLGILILSSGCGGGDSNDNTPDRTVVTSEIASAQCTFNAIPEASVPAVAPNSLLDFNHWSLALPVSPLGELEGSADVIEPLELLAGYSSDWFYVSQGNGTTFVAPVKGALTDNAKYTRSELRELISTEDPSQNWRVSDLANLSANAAVNHVPAASQKVAIGKIVAYNGGGVDPADIGYLMHLIYEFNPDTCSGKIHAIVNDSPFVSTTTTIRPVIAEGIALNEAFDFSVKVDSGILSIKVADQPEVHLPINANWNATDVYFKVGAGLTVTGDSTTDVAAVTFYRLNVTH